ncbi:hypothetical protein BH11PAT3_BH11PAT3_2260 [soil metagenome]
MRKIPYSIQGLIFAPALIGVIFVLKVSCPNSAGDWCFADNFVRPTFMPLKFLYQVFGNYAPILANHEPLFILAYWAIVGFLAGLLLELYVHMRKSPEVIGDFKDSVY